MKSTETWVGGVEIGGTKLQGVVGRADGHVEAAWRGNIDPREGARGIRATLAGPLAEWFSRWRLARIGVGFGGPVDRATGRICASHQVSGWESFPLGPWLADCWETPVTLENDANVAALGEALNGAGCGADPVFWINMGSGIGGGLVVGGRLYHGRAPGEMEVGHVRLDRSGTILEQRCSGWAVDGRVRALAREHPDSALGRMMSEAVSRGMPPGGEARWLARAWAEDDRRAWELLEEIAGDLAFALGHVVQLAHPEVIVMGGGLSLLGEPLRRAVADRLPGQVMDSFQPGPRVVLAGLGEASVPVGALRLAGADLFNGLDG